MHFLSDKRERTVKSFYLILANTFVATMTNLTVWFALVYFVYLQTHSVFATSMLSGSYLVFTALTGIWFGAIVDHHHKKTVMVWSSICSLVAYMIAAIIYGHAPVGAFTYIQSIYLWIWVAVLLIGVMAGNLRSIAMPTLVTLLVDKEGRAHANGLLGMASGVGYMVTSVISGFLVAKTAMWGAILGGILITVATLVHLLVSKIEEKKIIHIQGKQPKIDIKGTIATILSIPGLMAMILFATFNNFLGGVFMSLMDAYGLSLVSVEVWGTLWGVLGIAFVIGGLVISKWGLGKHPLSALMKANVVIWTVCAIFTVYPSIWLMAVGGFIYLAVIPYIEAAEQTIFQNLVPHDRQGRVFGFAQTVEQAASPLTAFAIGPITQFIVIPFMTDGFGAKVIGPWFGVGPARGIALVFTTAGLIGLMTTIAAWRSKYYLELRNHYHSEVNG